jgi:hypothetical protein
MDYWQWEEEEYDKRDKDATEGTFLDIQPVACSRLWESTTKICNLRMSKLRWN